MAVSALHLYERLEHDLAGCIGCGCLSLRACALLKPDGVLGERGSGPVRFDAEVAGDPARGEGQAGNASRR